MEEDLDHILLHQYHVSKNLGKKMIQAKKLMGDDPLLLEVTRLNKNRTQFFEDMIEDKTLLHKRKRMKKQKSHDLLTRNVFVESYKTMMLVSFYGYAIMSSTFRGYISAFTRKKDG